jgi:ribonuclease D
VADFGRIENHRDLDALVQELLSKKVVAIDTEADSFYHYFDKTCLVQIATRQQTYLVDPLALGGPAELAPLGPVLASPDIRKVFHAAEYDIYVLRRDCRFSFANLFDTMVSAQLLGYPSIGLAALAERHFGVSLPKDEQRSDWSVRPLRESQLNYAAADVTYLIPLAEKLERELKKAKRGNGPSASSTSWAICESRARRASIPGASQCCVSSIWFATCARGRSTAPPSRS